MAALRRRAEEDTPPVHVKQDYGGVEANHV
jgi:hypothetical protein